ncbi:hypothetical protein K3495_g12182 [Podosphaera aphanis]|nr:hypothetical protein K3495_g12182 [Podosphaera aphanis]
MDPRLNAQQNPPPPLTLSQDQLNELLSFIRTQNTPKVDEPRAPPQQPKNKPLRWPKWDGAQNTYSAYIDMLSTKIDEDWEILGGYKAVCNEIMSTIPTDCRLQVSHWFSCGWPKRNWDYKKFIEHLNENFEDKTSTRTASFTLAKMRQGKYQLFSEYLRDFEYTLAQAKGLNWEDRIKINDCIGGSMNDSPEHFSQLKSPRVIIPCLSTNAPRNSTVGNREALGSSRESNSTMSDSEGDTPMSGVNGISIEKLAALVNAVNAKSNGQESNKNERPLAPWRSPEEFSALRAAGKCTRCGKKGYWYKKCPRFTWARRPTGLNTTFSSPDVACAEYPSSIEDITKALKVKSKQTLEEIRTSLPQEIRHDAQFFTEDEKLNFPPHRPGADTKIDIIKDEKGREKDIPWGPLYDMSREELLVLRKTLTDHLGKNWIRASSSPGGAPVLFVKKPGGGLRFCVDYRALNAITVKDRYPLPLIKETLRQVARATWVSKVGVRAAFHKLRISEADEPKTVFRTRYGSFEWLVTPFGLTEAPGAFQRYINSVLGEFLGDFCSAYLDDVLICTIGDIADHWTKVNQVLQRLGIAGLQMDPKKSEFAVKQTKYLGFVISVTEGIKVDSDKIQANRDWQAPTNTFGGTAFKWENLHQKAFERLKKLFITAPILALWDDEKDTVLDADCSGYVIGGCLSQKDEKGHLRPVAYFSKELSPAEANYDIHDKELLVIVRCMEE